LDLGECKQGEQKYMVISFAVIILFNKLKFHKNGRRSKC